MALSWTFDVVALNNNASSLAPLPLSTVFFQVFNQYNATLFPGWCGQTGNCTIACLDAGQVFTNNTRLTQNCFLYPFIGAFMASNSLSRPILVAARSMGIVSDLETGKMIANVTQQCLFDYSLYLYQNQNTSTPFYPSASKIDRQTLYYADICGEATGGINPDIGGVGVYYSYWVQSILSIAFYIFMQITTSWSFWAARLVYLMYSCSTRSSLSSFNFARKVQARLKIHFDPLVTAMIDFHKAQCFFVLALETATLNVVTRPEKMAATFGSFLLPFLSIQYDLMSAISMGGMVPVTFTLLTIHIADRRSWFLLFLTSITVIISVTTYILLLKQGSDTQDAYTKTYAPLSCGAIDPAQFCASDFSELKKPAFWASPGASSMGISVITLILLIIDHFAHVFQPSWSRLRKKTDDPWLLQFNPQPPRNCGTTQACLFSWLTLWTFCCVAYIWSFAQIFRTLSISNPSSSSPSPSGTQGSIWSFGQIVAITVWIPSIIELGYLMHHGMEKGIQYRITRNFELIRVTASNKPAEEVHRTGYSVVSTFLQQPWTFIEAYRWKSKEDPSSPFVPFQNPYTPVVHVEEEIQAPHRRKPWYHSPSPGRRSSVQGPDTPPDLNQEIPPWRPLSLHLDNDPLLPQAQQSHLRRDSGAGLGLLRYNSHGSNSGINDIH